MDEKPRFSEPNVTFWTIRQNEELARRRRADRNRYLVLGAAVVVLLALLVLLQIWLGG